MKPLPSYWTLDRFINSLDNDLLQNLMHSQVKKLYELGVIDTSFIALDSTPIMANTSQNNPKSFKKDKFNPDNQTKSDKDCALGVHTASNQHNEKNVNSTGVTRTMCWLIALQAYRFLSLPLLPMYKTAQLPLIF